MKKLMYIFMLFLMVAASAIATEQQAEGQRSSSETGKKLELPTVC